MHAVTLQEVDSVSVGRSELRSENGQRVENRDISAFHTYFTHINFWDPLAFSFVYLFYYFVFNIDCEQVGAKGRIWKLTASTLSLRLFKRHSLDRENTHCQQRLALGVFRTMGKLWPMSFSTQQGQCQQQSDFSDTRERIETGQQTEVSEAYV